MPNGLTDEELKNKYWEIVKGEIDEETHVEYFTGSYTEMCKRCEELDTEYAIHGGYMINPLTKERK